MESCPINDLPEELREMVFLLCRPKDAANCRMVCRQWNEEISSNFMLMKHIWSTIETTKCMHMARDGNVDFFKAMALSKPT